MQEQINKNIERLTDKMMNELSIESPSLDFTNAIMSQVEALESKKTTTYKPLISKFLWLVIGFVLILITSCLFMNYSNEETSWIATLDFSKLTNNTLTQAFSGFSLPKTFMYAILFFGLMVCIQVPVLKHYFDKRLRV